MIPPIKPIVHFVPVSASRKQEPRFSGVYQVRSQPIHMQFAELLLRLVEEIPGFLEYIINKIKQKLH